MLMVKDTDFKELQDQLKDLGETLKELTAWKLRSDLAKAERLTHIYNDIADIFVKHGASIEETVLVLELANHDMKSQYISSRKTPEQIQAEITQLTH